MFAVFKGTEPGKKGRNVAATALVALLFFGTLQISAGTSLVNLGLAKNFALLTKAGVTTTGTTLITGDMGTSPIAATGLTGFDLMLDPSTTFSTSTLVTGNIYSASHAAPTPAMLTTAVHDMEAAYTDAAGRPLPDHVEYGAGSIEGQTLAPGLYKWGTSVGFTNGVTFDAGGDPNAIWILQVAQNLVVANDATVTLVNGATDGNIFWQVSGFVHLGTNSHAQGIILCKTAIVCLTGSRLSGAALAQTAVTLDATIITKCSTCT